MKKIGPCLWFDNQGEEAAKFYSTLFNTKIGTVARYGEAASKMAGQPLGSVMTVSTQIEDLPVLALNGGPILKFNPSFSFFVTCSSEAEITEKWQKLSSGGKVRMNLDKYPWAERYGWTTDKYGVEWQLIQNEASQKVVPAFLFVNQLFGKGQEAVNLYTSIFPNSKVEMMSKDDKTDTIMHTRFTLNGSGFVLMEGQGKHDNHMFDEAFSLMVPCDTQDEVDHYWSKLTANGGSEGPCGWCKDKFGVSWQIVYSDFDEIMKDPARANRAMAEIGKMKKLDINKIRAAAYGS